MTDRPTKEDRVIAVITGLFIMTGTLAMLWIVRRTDTDPGSAFAVGVAWALFMPGARK